MRKQALPVTASLFLVASAAAFTLSCDAPGPKQIGEATLAVLMAGHDPVPESAKDAPTVVMMPDRTTNIPDAPVVKLAIDRKVPWGAVKVVLAEMEERGQTAIPLVAERRKVRAFHIDDEIQGPIFQIYTYTDGKLCVSHPDVEQAKCVQSASKDYIDTAFTRELVREAVEGYERQNAWIALPEDLNWADVVAAIGGSRSCCQEKEIRLSVR